MRQVDDAMLRALAQNGGVVMTLPRQRFDVGTGHAFNVDASALASGTYLYRVIAQTSTRTLRHTGRMILSK